MNVWSTVWHAGVTSVFRLWSLMLNGKRDWALLRKGYMPKGQFLCVVVCMCVYMCHSSKLCLFLATHIHVLRSFLSECFINLLLMQSEGGKWGGGGDSTFIQCSHSFMLNHSYLHSRARFACFVSTVKLPPQKPCAFSSFPPMGRAVISYSIACW